jgi:SnoaL-like domain
LIPDPESAFRPPTVAANRRPYRVTRMTEPHPLRRAAETKDLELLSATLSEDVVLRSPIVFNAFEGRATVMPLLGHVLEVLEDFEYTDELREGAAVVLRFKGRVGDRELEGIDFLELNEDGKVTEVTVFMRPMSALSQFKEEIGKRLAAAEQSPSVAS